MNHYILRLIEDGTIQHLKRKWIPNNIRCETNPIQAYNLIIVIFWELHAQVVEVVLRVIKTTVIVITIIAKEKQLIVDFKPINHLHTIIQLPTIALRLA